tara:strand:+ start:3262 stop:3684 length:423 start_codon:yes stop_codon:yes gene_type:complete
MPGHYSSIVNLDEIVLSDYQRKVFQITQQLLQSTPDSVSGETVISDTYVIQKQILTMITESDSEGNASDDASRLVNMVLDIEEVAPTPTPVRRGSPRSNRRITTGSPIGSTTTSSIIRGAGSALAGADQTARQSQMSSRG